MTDKVPLHPILFALLPVLTAYTSLINYVLPEELILPTVVNLLVGTVAFAISYLFLRHVRRAAIVTSVTVLMVYTFDALAILLNRGFASVKITGNDAYYVIPYLFIAGGIIAVFSRSKNEFLLLTKFLNIVSLVLVIGNLGYAALHEYQIQSALGQAYARQAREMEAINLVQRQESPDIYYIILDAFARTETLQEFYGYDNSGFIKKLEERGFRVAKHSKSNYQMTCLSLPSSLNMEYLTYLEKIMGRDSLDYIVLSRLVQHNAVALSLKKIGYQFVNMRSGYAPSDYIPEADENVGYPFGNIFHLAFARGTIVGPFQRYFDFLGQAARNVRTYAIEHADEIIARKSPKFAFIHILIPHPPFLFHEDGTPANLDQISLSESYTKEKYLAQIKYIQSHVLTLLDKLNKDPRKKVVIVQGDHGPSLQEGADGNPSPSFLQERFRILNAYRLPDADSDTIYDGITPVNSFRVVFNKYFDAKLPLLEDKCYFSPTLLPFEFEEVTDIVKP